MNSPFPPLSTNHVADSEHNARARAWGRRLAALLLAGSLAACSHTPDATTEVPTAAAPALTTAAVTAPAPVAPAPAPPAATVKPAAKPKVLRPLRTAQPAAAAPAVAEEAPTEAAAPAPAPAPAEPATRTQAGRVLDEAGQPLVGATVMLKGSSTITSTDANGSYSVEVPAGENTFLVGYGGYEDEIAKSRNGEPLNVTLLPKPGNHSKPRRTRR